MSIEFTEQQKKIIAHDPSKNGVVRAGPGTGKSITVVALAQRLAKEGGFPAIKFLTFTRAATSELAKKIETTKDLAVKPSTVHSFAISILMKNQNDLPTKLPLRIPTEHEVDDVIYPFISKKSSIRKNRVGKLVRLMASMWESLADEKSNKFSPEERARFNSAFQLATKIFGFTLLEQLPDLLRKIIAEQRDVKGLDFSLLIVDEYQDLNKCEVELLRLLQQKNISVLAVGDEDQSIYSFRRAHPAGIRDFEQTFTFAEVYDLSVCHRCPKNLIDWAQHVIQGDLQRSRRPALESTSTIQAKTYLLHFKSGTSEAKGVARIIEYLINTKGYSASDILVLSRTDKDERFTKEVKKELQNKSIPVFDSKAFKKILESKETRKLFSLLRLLNDKLDSLAWFTLIKNEAGLGPRTLNDLIKKAEQDNTDFAHAVLNEIENSYPLINNQAFKVLTKSVETTIANYEVRKSTEITQWGQWIINNAPQILKTSVSKELAQLFLQVDKKIEEDKLNLGFFLSQMVPILKDLANEQKSGVRFMTMQGSKGLTARATVVIGVDNDLIPRPEQDSSEERRLLYVGMTRSQEVLVMTWANRRRGSQARSGNPNVWKRRNYSDFLQNGPIRSTSGEVFVNKLK